MRILTFNIQGQENWDSLREISETISRSNADIVLLQEVMRLDRLTQADLINQELGYSWMTSSVTRFYSSPKTGKKFFEGLAVLSRYPIVTCESLVLQPIEGDKHQRIVQFLQIDIAGKPVDIVNLHLSNRQAFAEQQFSEVQELVGDRHVILGGDFNMYDLQPLRALGAYTFSYDIEHYITNTDKNDGSVHALDHVLVPVGYSITSVVAIEQSVSDHSPLLVDVSPS